MPVTVDGEQVKLAVLTYKPAGDGPFPTLVFHHGSTGNAKILLTSPTRTIRRCSPNGSQRGDGRFCYRLAAAAAARRAVTTKGSQQTGRKATAANRRCPSPALTAPCATSMP